MTSCPIGSLLLSFMAGRASPPSPGSLTSPSSPALVLQPGLASKSGDNNNAVTTRNLDIARSMPDETPTPDRAVCEWSLDTREEGHGFKSHAQSPPSAL